MATNHRKYGRSVAVRLRFELERRGWPVETLAQLSGLSRSHLSLILNGGRPNVSASTVARIAEAMGVTSDWMLGLSDDPKPR